jgi:Flp pilus assembly protein TadG
MKRASHWKTVQRWKTSGQALILIVITFMGLLLFLGLMVDLGQIFLAKGYLRRAADSASLAAAAQFRENRGIDEMRDAAFEAANMNGIAPTSVDVETCATAVPSPDPALCPKFGDMPKKLVRVTIVMDYPLTFLSLLNIYTVRLTETSISEAASMDVVLVIDTSESMSFDSSFAGGPIGHDPRDPSICNNDAAHPCQPFKAVKSAALSFADRILDKPKLEEEDRLAIVTFANGWQFGSQGTQVAMTWTNEYATAAAAIGDPNDPTKGLQVYDPGWACPYGLYEGVLADHTKILSPCRYYGADGTYYNLSCPFCNDLDTDAGHHVGDQAGISAFTTTDIGGAMLLAGEQFAVQKRPEALWVVVLLTDGQANATFATKEDIGQSGNSAIYPSWIDPSLYDTVETHLPLGFCPDSDWVGPSDNPNRRYCQDGDVDTHHALSDPPGNYDADDFARDQGRFVACAASNPAAGCNGIKGQGGVLFTIGLGKEVLALDDDTVHGQKPYGESLLRFLAAIGDDGNPATDPCASTAIGNSCGNYFYAEHGTDLDKIFEAIYSRIFTRLTQ